MACIQHIYVFSFLLAIIAGHVFLLTEGRQPKAFNKQKSDSFDDDKGQGNQRKDPIGSKKIPAGHKRDLQVTSPPPSHDISRVNEFFPPMSRIGPKKSLEFDNSLTAYANGFQHTTPGNSPGVGHSYVGRKEENEQKAPSTPNGALSLDKNPNDSKPTGPGRSPGIGHSYRSTHAKPNA